MKRPTRISPFHIGLRRPTPGTQAGSPKPTSPRATPTASSGPWCRCTARTWRSSSTAWPASPPTRHPRRTRRASATSTSRAPRRRDLVTRLHRHLRWLPRRHLPPHGRGGAPGHDRVPPPPERPRRRAQGHRADGRLRLRRGRRLKYIRSVNGSAYDTGGACGRPPRASHQLPRSWSLHLRLHGQRPNLLERTSLPRQRPRGVWFYPNT